MYYSDPYRPSCPLCVTGIVFFGYLHDFRNICCNFLLDIKMHWRIGYIINDRYAIQMQIKGQRPEGYNYRLNQAPAHSSLWYFWCDIVWYLCDIAWYSLMWCGLISLWYSLISLWCSTEIILIFLTMEPDWSETISGGGHWQICLASLSQLHCHLNLNCNFCPSSCNCSVFYIQIAIFVNLLRKAHGSMMYPWSSWRGWKCNFVSVYLCVFICVFCVFVH